MTDPIFVEDGDTLVVIAKAPGPTVNDPADERPYVSQGYRCVADRSGPTLVLVPLGEKPTSVPRAEVEQYFSRKAREAGLMSGS